MGPEGENWPKIIKAKSHFYLVSTRLKPLNKALSSCFSSKLTFSCICAAYLIRNTSFSCKNLPLDPYGSRGSIRGRGPVVLKLYFLKKITKHNFKIFSTKSMFDTHKYWFFWKNEQHHVKDLIFLRRYVRVGNCALARARHTARAVLVPCRA